MITKVALSTIAMSAYNVLAKQSGPAEASRIFQVVSSGLMDPGITKDVFAKALAELEQRGLIAIVDKEKGLIDVVDELRRVVRWRSRAPATGGWDNWLVDGVQGPTPVPRRIPTEGMSIDLGAMP